MPFVLRRRLDFFLLLLTASGAAGQEFVHDAFRSISGVESIEAEIIKRVNVERRQRKLNELLPDAALRSAARQHSLEMLDSGYFAHESPVASWRQPGDRVYYAGLTDFVVGENIAVNSVRGNARTVAEAFVEQWMNSPGHRENILRPNFTHLGVGVVVRADSSVVDTIIAGRPTRLTIASLRNMGTQVFSDRDVEFTSLHMTTEATPRVHVMAQFQSERSLLVTYGEFSRIFPSEDGRTTLRLSFPVVDGGELQIAYAENEHTQDYVIMTRLPLDEKSRIPAIYDRLQGLTFPLLDREIRFSRDSVRWLNADFRWAGRGEPGACSVYIGTEAYRVYGSHIRAPLLEEHGEMTLGCGPGREKTVKHRVRYDPASSDGFGRESSRTSR